MRPDAALARQIRYDPYFRDSVAAVADIRCPALFVLATENLPGLPGRVGDLMPATLEGVNATAPGAVRVGYARCCTDEQDVVVQRNCRR